MLSVTLAKRRHERPEKFPECALKSDHSQCGRYSRQADEKREKQQCAAEPREDDRIGKEFYH